MICESVKFMVVDTTTVMLFLLVMVSLINFAYILTCDAASCEIKTIASDRALPAKSWKRVNEIAVGDVGEDIAVIAATVVKYEAERYAQIQPGNMRVVG